MSAVENVEIAGKLVDSPVKHKHKPSALDNFTKLTNGVEITRIQGGVDLLKHVTIDSGTDELKYALARLIRGLGSSKVQAKVGFFAALVGLLNLKNVPVDEIFQHVTKELHRGSGNSKTENADVSFGQILVCGAIVRSNLYESLTNSEKSKVLELLVTAGKERSYLTLASYKFLEDLLSKSGQKEFEKSIFPVIKTELSKPLEEQDLDGLFLLMQVQKKFPQCLHSLGRAELLGSDTLQTVCNVITTIPRHSALKHPVFDLLIENVAESPDLIVEFFELLDQSLAKPNRNKYLAITKLLIGVVARLKSSSILPELLTRNYLQQTLNTYKTAVGRNKDKEFHELSHKLFDALLDALKKDEVKDKIRIKVLRKLLFYPGTFIFEKITKSRLIQDITGTLKSKGVKKLGVIYAEVVQATSADNSRWLNLDRTYAAHLLVKLLNHPSMQEENDWKVEQMVLLMRLGLLKDQEESVGQELAESFKEAFYSSLNLKLIKMERIRSILSSVVHHVDATINADNLETVLRHPLTADNYGTWRRTLELASKLESHAKKKRNTVFHILFLHLSLQLFNNTKLASDALVELFSCYERAKKSKSKEVDANDPLWIEVVVDLFLNLLSHSSNLLRSVISYVFPYLCGYMNATAIHQILAALDPKNESNPLSNADDDSDDESMSEGSESEESSDEEDIEDDDNVNDKLRMALQQVLHANPESDAESIDLDNLDEAQGEELDRALGDAFKQFKPNLGRKKKQNKEDEMLMHFRIRVLDLIEVYLNSNPSMLLTLEIMLPLLHMLEFCIRDERQRPLRDRVSACLKKLCSLKKFADWDDVEEDVLVNLLKSLLEKGARSMTMIQEMEEEIADCCTFIIGCSQIVGERKRISGVMAESLEAYFKQRESVIPYVLFKNLVQLNWDGNLELASLLCQYAFSDSVRPFRRSQGLALLKLFYNNHRLIAASAEQTNHLEEDTAGFLKTSIDFFREICANPNDQKVKERFVCGLFEVLASIKNGILQKSFGHWEILGDNAREFRSQFTLARDTKLAFNKLCKSLNVSNIVQMKSQPIRLNNVEEGESKVVKKQVEKKRRGVSNDTKKLKKETKELRLKSLSEGLGKRKMNWESDEEDNKKIKV